MLAHARRIFRNGGPRQNRVANVCYECRVRVKRTDIFCPFCERRVWSVSKMIAIAGGITVALIVAFSLFNLV